MPVFAERSTRKCVWKYMVRKYFNEIKLIQMTKLLLFNQKTQSIFNKNDKHVKLRFF